MTESSWFKIALRELADRWQIPTLVLSIVLAALGVYRIVSSQKSKSIEQYISACDKFFAQGQYLESAKMAAVLLEDEDLKPTQRAHLNSLLAQIFFIKEKTLEDHNPKKLSIIFRHLKKVSEIRKLNAQEHLMLGYIYSWQKKYDEAVDYFEESLAEGSDKKIEILKQLIKILPRTSKHNIRKRYVYTLNRLYSQKGLSESDFVWVLGLKTELLFKKGKFSQAVALIKQALKRVKQQENKLQLEYSLALGQYYQHQLDLAEPALRDILNKLASRGELDAKVTLLLGRICFDDERPEEAIAFFKSVIREHPLTDYHLAAVLYRARAEIVLHRFDDAISSYKECFSLLSQLGNNRLVSKEDILKSLESVFGELAKNNNLEQAVRFAVLQLNHIDKNNFLVRNVLIGRIAGWYRQLGDAEAKRLKKIQDASLAEKVRAKMRNCYMQAGKYYVEFSHSEGILHSDAAEALWDGIVSYEKAGGGARMVKLLEEFVQDWPTDNHIPEGLFKLARIYQSENRFADARKNYQKLIKEYTRTPWGLRSLVPLATTYIAMGPKGYGKAEKILLDIVDDTSRQELFTPASTEYRKALFLLGRLYYQMGKYDLALARLEETMERYKNSREVPEAEFLLAQCYRKVSNQYLSQAKETSDRVISRRLMHGWRSNLTMAKDAYRKAISALDSLKNRSTLEDSYLKLAYVYYADSLYDLGEYGKAIKAYEQVVDRYDRSPIALAGYVQIVNAYQRLGQPERTRAILERMKWLLNQLPDEVFVRQGLPMSRKDWQRWIDWNYRSGLTDYSDAGLAASN